MNDNIQYSKILVSFTIFITAILFYSSVFGNVTFFSRGEAREALVTQAMYEQNNYVLPLTKANEISCKPPALHWIGLASSKVLGECSERSIRFPSILLSSLSLVLLFLFFSHATSIQTGLFTILILGTSIEWLRSSSHARVDMCLAFGINLCLCAFYFLLNSKSRKSYWAYFAFATLGSMIAVWSKGPMGLAIPIAVISIYFFLTEKKNKFKNSFKFAFSTLIPYLLLTFTLSGIWYYLAYHQQGDLFYKVHIINENLARFIDVPDFSPGHRHPFYYSFIYLFTSFLPWTMFFPSFFVFNWKEKIKERQVLFSLVWFLVVFLLCTVSSSKRSVYLLPALAPLAYLLTLSIKSFFANFDKFKITRNIISISELLFFLLILSIFSLTILTPENLISNFVKEKDMIKLKDFLSLIHVSKVTFYIFFLGLISYFFSMHFLKKNLLKNTILLKTLSIVLITLSISVILHNFSDERKNNLVFKYLSEANTSDIPVYQYIDTFFEITYYSTQVMPRVRDIKKILDDEYYLLSAAKYSSKILKEKPDAKIVFENNNSFQDDISLLKIG